MSLTKEYIKGQSRQFRITIMAWIIESFQEEDMDWTPTDEQKRK